MIWTNLKRVYKNVQGSHSGRFEDGFPDGTYQVLKFTPEMVVLCSLVDGEIPRLSKEMYKRIDSHLHAAVKYGLVETAKYQGFESAFGFYNHLSGMVAIIKDVDAARWSLFHEQMTQIVCPWDEPQDHRERPWQ